MIRRFFTFLWPTLVGPQPPVTIPEVDRIQLPPEPMFKAPDDREWLPL